MKIKYFEEEVAKNISAFTISVVINNFILSLWGPIKIRYFSFVRGHRYVANKTCCTIITTHYSYFQ